MPKNEGGGLLAGAVIHEAWIGGYKEAKAARTATSFSAANLAAQVNRPYLVG